MAIGVLADANVLFSRTMRDWLFLLRNKSGGNLFVVYSTEDIIAEVVYRWRRANPEADGIITTRMHDLIVAQIDDRIEDFQMDDSYPGNDPDDQHVHAAAVSSGAGIVLTADTGFTELTDDQKDVLPYDIYTPDEFFVLADDSVPEVVRQVTVEQRDYWAAKPDSRSLPDQLVAAQCPEFAARVRGYLDD